MTSLLSALLHAAACIEDSRHCPIHLCGSSRAVVAFYSLQQSLQLRDENGHTPLHYACAVDVDSSIAVTNGMAVIEAMLWLGADVHQADRYGYLPAHVATLNDLAAALVILLDAGTDVDVCIDDGTPLLSMAAPRGGACLQVLLARGADVLKSNHEGSTVLHEVAGYSAAVGSVSMLCDAGADVNAGNVMGDTPLHVAARRPDGAAMVEALLRAGADRSRRNLRGRTPADESAEAGGPNI